MLKSNLRLNYIAGHLMRFLLVLVLCTLFSTNALSQISTAPLQTASAPAEKVEINATRPIILNDGKLRVMFRLTSKENNETPYAVTNNNGGLYNWTAFTQRGVSCKTYYNDVKNVPSIFARHASSIKSELRDYDGSQASAGQTRPAIVIADFRCDGKISSGDFVTISTRWYYLLSGKWKAADYVFENTQVSE